MIPKVIHYCWFGRSSHSEFMQHCINSWKKYCPDYQIIEWNDDNFNLDLNLYVRQAYDNKMWAFVSDVARLYVLVQYGGFYLDTDVELLKPLDEFVNYRAISGFETQDKIPTGLMACEKGFPLFKGLLEEYQTRTFIKNDGTFDRTTNVTYITNTCLSHGLALNNQRQNILGFEIFPSDYFCPKSYETGLLHITNNTYAIHHFNGSWLSEEQRYAHKLGQKIRLPNPLNSYIASFISICKFKGIWFALQKTIYKLLQINN